MSDSKRDLSVFFSKYRRVLLYCLAGGIVILGIGLLTLQISIRSILDARFFESRLTRALDGATAERYTVSVGTVEWDLWGWSLQLKDVTVRPDRQRDGAQPSFHRPSRRVRGSIPALDLRGIDVWALLWRRSLRLDEVLVRRPRVAILNHDASTRSPPDASVEAEDSTRRQDRLSGVHVDRLRVIPSGAYRRSSRASGRRPWPERR